MFYVPLGNIILFSPCIIPMLAPRTKPLQLA